ncbi:integrase [Pseudoalteromonas porphyrae]|uniref:tyrosine-type recombinase/integrase n=1 Tax=Pseudoalteromonas TaxID=53246 RepID=UPI0006BA8B6B|nr:MULTISPECIES: tyrosine-type recombinase/integrase [Pseudoalteromonas]KPH94812.1 integrase [Pseudoalteromonas porphyrae]
MARNPFTILTREGLPLNASTDKWDLPYTMRGNSTLDFSKIVLDGVRWGLKFYIKDRIERVSTHAGYAAFHDVWREFLRNDTLLLQSAGSSLQDRLISLIESSISIARKKHRLWALYRPIQWYIYCAENYPELGFSPAYALELEGMSIPANPKGEAVRMEDPDKGPLHRSLELPLLIAALKNDTSQELEHLQQKAAVALSIAFGRNPANLTYLREEDFIDLTPESNERCCILKMPRIKKRQLNPRDDLLDEYLEPLYGNYIMELIQKNSSTNVMLEDEGEAIPNPRPLFLNQKGNSAAIASKDFENAYNVTSSDITTLLKKFVIRHKIISPVTNSLLQISTRRLRYTLAVGLASEGISKKELARILDHTDTQHVLVYFEMAGKIVEHLDKAAAKGLSSYLQLFKGRVIDLDEEAVNGNRVDKHIAFVDEENPEEQAEIGVCGEGKLCHLDPPYSCYLCPKFQPYRHADHEYVLECLLQNREKRLEKYESSRLGVQLDDVIAAVAQVTELCSEAQ